MIGMKMRNGLYGKVEKNTRGYMKSLRVRQKQPLSAKGTGGIGE